MTSLKTAVSTLYYYQLIIKWPTARYQKTSDPDEYVWIKMKSLMDKTFKSEGDGDGCHPTKVINIYFRNKVSQGILQQTGIK